MEGLLIAEQLRALAPRLPAERKGWRFPDDRTAVLPLVGEVSLWLTSRPPTPRFEVRRGAPPDTAPHTPFQAQLAARATGALVEASQPALDRVVRFVFAPTGGFVPEPGTTLVAELTGRNANLVLLAENGTIIGVERVILSQRNRYRELRPGAPYVPPPPYDKLDPLEASKAELGETLRGRRITEVRDLVDGIGPRLMAALRSRVGADDGGTTGPSAAGQSAAGPSTAGASTNDAVPLEGERLTRVVTALRRLAVAPAAALSEHGETTDVAGLAKDRRLGEMRAELGAALARRHKLAERRVADAEQAATAATEVDLLRQEGDLLLANAGRFTAAGARATLRGFDGEEVVLEVDPRLDAAGNAKARYDRAKRREARSARAVRQLPELRAELAAAERARAQLETADEETLRTLARNWDVDDVTGGGRGPAGSRANARTAGAAERHGVRFVDPRGYEVFVGRSAKENDAITFKLARSRDLWLHVQGYRGAHVVVRSQGKELPFDTVLFAARLAAGFSQARDSDNVPVDYTARKNVWRQKGAPAGAVNFAHHKTVYVTPARDDAAARAHQTSA